LSVETFAVALPEGRKRNAEACGNLLKAVRGLGIAERDIATAALGVTPQLKDENHPAKGVEGYFLRRDYTVQVRQLASIEAVVDTVLAAGANRLLSIEFGSTRQAQLRNDARASAARAAQSKAATLAAALGGRLGSARQINEENPEWGRGLNFVTSRP